MLADSVKGQGMNLVYKNSKQSQGSSKVTISPLNQKKEKMSSWAVGQSHLEARTIAVTWILRSSVSK